MALAGRSSVQDLAAVTLDRDLRDLWHAQRSTACSPRLPAVADGLSHRATSYPASGQSVVVACSTRRRRSRSARGWGRRGRSRVGECRTRSRSCLDHADQGIHASAPEPPRSVQCRRPSSAKAAPRRRDVGRAAPQRPREPRDGSPARQRSAAGQRMLAGTTRRPPWWRRSGSITRRSPTVHAVSGSFIRRSPDTRWRRRLNDGIPRGDTAALACCGSHPQLGRKPLGSRRDPPRSTALENP